MSMLHPGFNKTDMTKKYEAIWAIEGPSVCPSVRPLNVLKSIHFATFFLRCGIYVVNNCVNYCVVDCVIFL